MKVGEHPVPKWGYSVIGLDADTAARASGRELWEEHLLVLRRCATRKSFFSRLGES